MRAEIAKVKQELSAAGVQTRTFGDRLSNIGANMFAATGIIGGFTALYSVVSKAFTTIKEFASGISELKAITGASGDDLEYLKQKAKDMSAQYGTSAREVVNAMKMVGSAKPELLSNVRLWARLLMLCLHFRKLLAWIYRLQPLVLPPL